MFFRSGQWSVCCQSCANEADISSSVSVDELLKDMAEMDAEAVAEMRDVDEARSGVPVDPRRISRQDGNDDVGHQTAFDQIHNLSVVIPCSCFGAFFSISQIDDQWQHQRILWSFLFRCLACHYACCIDQCMELLWDLCIDVLLDQCMACVAVCQVNSHRDTGADHPLTVWLTSNDSKSKTIVLLLACCLPASDILWKPQPSNQTQVESIRRHPNVQGLDICSQSIAANHCYCNSLRSK